MEGLVGRERLPVTSALLALLLYSLTAELDFLQDPLPGRHPGRRRRRAVVKYPDTPCAELLDAVLEGGVRASAGLKLDATTIGTSMPMHSNRMLSARLSAMPAAHLHTVLQPDRKHVRLSLVITVG
jgi:hypothetical protein